MSLTDQYDKDQIWWDASSFIEIMKTFLGDEGVRILFLIE